MKFIIQNPEESSDKPVVLSLVNNSGGGVRVMANGISLLTINKTGVGYVGNTDEETQILKSFGFQFRETTNNWQVW
mgnify:CR=1 FL=1